MLYNYNIYYTNYYTKFDTKYTNIPKFLVYKNKNKIARNVENKGVRV